MSQWNRAHLDVTGYDVITIRRKNKSITISKDEWDELCNLKDEITDALKDGVEKNWENKHGKCKFYTSKFKGEWYIHIRIMWGDNMPSSEGVGMPLTHWNHFRSTYIDLNKQKQRGVDVFAEMVIKHMKQQLHQKVELNPKAEIGELEMMNLYANAYNSIIPNQFIMKLALKCSEDDDVTDLDVPVEVFLVVKFLHKDKVKEIVLKFINHFFGDDTQHTKRPIETNKENMDPRLNSEFKSTLAEDVVGFDPIDSIQRDKQKNENPFFELKLPNIKKIKSEHQPKKDSPRPELRYECDCGDCTEHDLSEYQELIDSSSEDEYSKNNTLSSLD